METHVHFKAGKIVLEGLLHRGSENKGVVITHPHSLYGGNMYNPVVETISRAYQGKNFSTLRFNFRGVAGSSGQFDDGAGERQDVLEALCYLFNSGFTSLHLAGYSFGTRVMAGIEKYPEYVKSQIHVSPPVAFMDYTGVKDIEKLKTVIVGSLDEIAPPKEIREFLPAWNSGAELRVIDGADHFFSHGLDQLREILGEVLNE